MKICFCATKNLYYKLAIVITSLLHYNPSIETIYLIIEDDEWQYIKDKRIKIINIKKLELDISESNPNLKRFCTYMSLMRAYLPLILSNEDKIISSDCDILFNGKLDEIWNWNLNNNYLAAVPEWGKSMELGSSTWNFPYVNTGFILMDLKAMREKHIVDQLIDLMNVYPLNWPDQDAFNIVCRNNIELLPYKYNSNIYTGISKTPIIIHGTPVKPWEPNGPYWKIWQHYEEMYKNEYTIANIGENKNVF